MGSRVCATAALNRTILGEELGRYRMPMYFFLKEWVKLVRIDGYGEGCILHVIHAFFNGLIYIDHNYQGSV